MQVERVKIGNYLFIIHELESKEERMLLESTNKGTPLVGQYSYQKHQPHNPTGEYHVHVYKKNNEIFSINKSGKGHDGSSGTRIPNDVFSALSSKFPDWTWPKSQIVESLNHQIILDKNMKENLRPVHVSRHSLNTKEIEHFDGYFHTFADDPFVTGGNGGWFAKTIALVEDDRGNIRKVGVDSLRFMDVEEFL